MAECNQLEYEPEILRVFQSKGERRAFYDKIAGVYDFLAERSERPARERGIALLAPSPGEHLLEIGFGTGHCLVELAEAVGANGKVYGIDLSGRMLARTRDLLEEEHLAARAELTTGDAERLPYGSATLDGIFMSFVLEMFDTPDIPCVLDECQRVLKRNGRIVVVGISREEDSGKALRAFEWAHQHFPNLLDCRPILVRRALERAGFVVEQAEVIHLWVPLEIVKGVKS
jgi:demethylmenaquinone methyltransferase/2-methoxy-6-polyprenyl-1,4-benzoquinol methylase